MRIEVWGPEGTIEEIDSRGPTPRSSDKKDEPPPVNPPQEPKILEPQVPSSNIFSDQYY